RKVLKELPFQQTSFAEDALWAKDVLLHGYAIVYNTAARVYHYHLSDPQFVVKRQFTVFFHFYQYFSYKPTEVKNNLWSVLRNLKLILPISQLSFKDKIKWLLYNWRIRKNINKAVRLFSKYEN